MDKPVLWFEENQAEFSLPERKTWLNRHAFTIKSGQHILLNSLQQELYRLNYDKVFEPPLPGEYRVLGGVVEIFPINTLKKFTLEFSGNTIATIAASTEEISEAQRSAMLKRKQGDAFSLKTLEQLKSGSWVVHQDHGIGRFRGYQERTLDGVTRNYFIIEYAPPRKDAAPDTLLVPPEQARKISRYIGFAKPKLHRLGTQTWHKTLLAIKEEAAHLAQELLSIYAKREVVHRPPYHIDKTLLDEARAGFTFQETPDQQEAEAAVLSDLKKDTPMDRLICGDVGFGKTEIALRAAVMAVGSGRQVALLCPTTILADQHFKTFSSRLDKLGIRVGLLSRFESKSSQGLTLAALKRGSMDILIGTHRALSSDVHFKNLGLLIIDEEQRFGVKQKEHFKQLRAAVDVLSLSATPIPRTLSFALTHLRDYNLIQTPPQGRQAVETFVEPFRTETLRLAIDRELKREGQIFYLHNRIDTLEHATELVRKLFPHARVASGHGRQPEAHLRRTMDGFREKKYDILVATTIIENGLDVSNANTLIVDDATRLGLAQAHQLRGRVGRGEEKAYAYFFYPEAKNMTPEQHARLEALEETAHLGSGFEISQKDLEIRGPGNILGKEQSGNINRVGFNLYCELIAEAVDRLQKK